MSKLRCSTLTARIELKTTPEVKELLLRAANLSGVNLTAFIISCAYEKAMEQQQTNILLNKKDWANLKSILDNPPPATKELKELLK